MLAPTKPFITINAYANISKEESHVQWKALWSQAYEDFLRWVLTKLSLKKEQLEKLETLFNDLTTEEVHDTTFMELFKPIFTHQQYALAQDTLTGFFLDHLETFYEKILAKIPDEKTQALERYLAA